MNDRFKFRYVIDNKIYNVKDIDFRNNTISIELEDDGLVYKYKTLELDYSKLVQCTGLKDKNSKLIYEGDILKVADGSLNGNILYFTKPVKWEINRWVNCPYWLYRETDKTHFAEVIGNIYENKELLDGNGN